MSEVKKDIFNISQIDDLPKEITDQLMAYKENVFEKNLYKLFYLSKGNLNIDQILAAYYRKFKKILARRSLNSKLYNMTRCENPILENIPGKKGVYRLKK